MERAEPEIGASLSGQLHILGYHIYNIIFHPYFFNDIVRIPHVSPPLIHFTSIAFHRQYVTENAILIYFPGFRNIDFPEFLHGILVCHTGQVIADRLGFRHSPVGHQFPVLPGHGIGVLYVILI